MDGDKRTSCRSTQYTSSDWAYDMNGSVAAIKSQWPQGNRPEEAAAPPMARAVPPESQAALLGAESPVKQVSPRLASRLALVQLMSALS